MYTSSIAWCPADKNTNCDYNVRMAEALPGKEIKLALHQFIVAVRN